MNADVAADRQWWRTALRWLVWAGAAGLLLTPLVAMQFTDEVKWGPASFVVAGTLLFGSAGLIDLAIRRSASIFHVAGTIVAVGTAFLLVWSNLAVGIIGDEDNPQNLLFFAVVGMAIAGAVAARFRSRGMALAMLAAGVAQAAIAGIAALSGWGADEPPGTARLTVLILAFALGWLLSAGLFGLAARGAR